MRWRDEVATRVKIAQAAARKAFSADGRRSLFAAEGVQRWAGLRRCGGEGEKSSRGERLGGECERASVRVGGWEGGGGRFMNLSFRSIDVMNILHQKKPFLLILISIKESYTPPSVSSFLCSFLLSFPPSDPNEHRSACQRQRARQRGHTLKPAHHLSPPPTSLFRDVTVKSPPLYPREGVRLGIQVVSKHRAGVPPPVGG